MTWPSSRSFNHLKQKRQSDPFGEVIYKIHRHPSHAPTRPYCTKGRKSNNTKTRALELNENQGKGVETYEWTFTDSPKKETFLICTDNGMEIYFLKARDCEMFNEIQGFKEEPINWNFKKLSFFFFFFGHCPILLTRSWQTFWCGLIQFEIAQAHVHHGRFSHKSSQQKLDICWTDHIVSVIKGTNEAMGVKITYYFTLLVEVWMCSFWNFIDQINTNKHGRL